MANYQSAVRREGAHAQQIDAGLRAHMTSIYSLMGVAMLVTGAVAYVFGQDLYAVLSALRVGATPETAVIPASVIEAIFFSPLKWVVMLAPLGIVFLFGATVHRMQPATAQMVFWAFAALMGLSISSIFAIYTGISIAQTFFATAIAFLSLSLYGYTTRRDLSAMGSFLIMGVVGLVVASLVNMFIGSSALQFAISVLGILIFAGLTAYDTQRLKSQYVQLASMGAGAQMMSAAAISGALSLYLNFLNMFMFLLQFMGQARD